MARTRKPPMKASDEATRKQLDMATSQGSEYVKAVEHMAKEVADAGGEKRAGDYVVGYAVEEAEGMHHLREGGLEWREPGLANTHFEVSVRDASDDRFIPNLDVHLTVEDADGREIGTHRQPFVWHPWVYHYGRNWTLPGSGRYTLRVRIAAPKFPRHDEENGARYAEDVEVEFRGVKIEVE